MKSFIERYFSSSVDHAHVVLKVAKRPTERAQKECRTQAGGNHQEDGGAEQPAPGEHHKKIYKVQD